MIKPITQIFFLPVEKTKEKKKKKPIKSKRKICDLFHEKTAFQNECHAKESRCCKVLSFFHRFQQDFSFENSLLTMTEAYNPERGYMLLTMNNTVTQRH